jgi:hypothetical protein
LGETSTEVHSRFTNHPSSIRRVLFTGRSPQVLEKNELFDSFLVWYIIN